jgi:hypothetical protein
MAELRRRVAYAQFTDGLWNLLNDSVARLQLREALIARYFPEEREKLAALAATGRAVSTADTFRDELPPGRDSAFRRTILVGFESYLIRR